MSEPYSCRGETFPDQMSAHLAVARMAQHGRLIDQPRIYRCTEGHWHHSAQLDPEATS